MKKLIVLFLVLGFGLASASIGKADSLGVDFGTGSYSVQGYSGQDYTLGYEFTLSQAATVTGLGFWDQGNGYGYSKVGLWDTGGTLLAAVDTTTNAGTLSSFATGNGFGEWNFMDVNAPVNLAAGNYIVGAWGQEAEFAYTDPINPLVMAPNTTFVQTAWNYGGLNFPSIHDNVWNGYFGGNVRLASSEVPTPSSFAALIGMGLMGLVAVRRRRKK